MLPIINHCMSVPWFKSFNGPEYVEHPSYQAWKSCKAYCCLPPQSLVLKLVFAQHTQAILAFHQVMTHTKSSFISGSFVAQTLSQPAIPSPTPANLSLCIYPKSASMSSPQKGLSSLCPPFPLVSSTTLLRYDLYTIKLHSTKFMHSGEMGHHPYLNCHQQLTYIPGIPQDACYTTQLWGKSLSLSSNLIHVPTIAVSITGLHSRLTSSSPIEDEMINDLWCFLFWLPLFYISS